jgi:hypothetical protein
MWTKFAVVILIASNTVTDGCYARLAACTIYVVMGVRCLAIGGMT